MPSYREFTWSDYKVSVRPTDWRKVFRFIPYLNGTNVNLAIFIKTLSGAKRKFSYRWVLYRWDGKNQIHQKEDGKSFRFKPQNEIRENLNIPYLSIPNNYYIHVLLIEEGDRGGSDRQVVTNFTLLDRDMFTVRLAIGIGLLILGGIITVLIKLFYG